VPLLHAAVDNTSAIRLYETMGFTHRALVRFVAVRVPGVPPTTPAPNDLPVRC
jgi:hypothetical protein